MSINDAECSIDAKRPRTAPCSDGTVFATAESWLSAEMTDLLLEDVDRVDRTDDEEAAILLKVKKVMAAIQLEPNYFKNLKANISKNGAVVKLRMTNRITGKDVFGNVILPIITWDAFSGSNYKAPATEYGAYGKNTADEATESIHANLVLATPPADDLIAVVLHPFHVELAAWMTQIQEDLLNLDPTGGLRGTLMLPIVKGQSRKEQHVIRQPPEGTNWLGKMNLKAPHTKSESNAYKHGLVEPNEHAYPAQHTAYIH